MNRWKALSLRSYPSNGFPIDTPFPDLRDLGVPHLSGLIYGVAPKARMLHRRTRIASTNFFMTLISDLIALDRTACWFKPIAPRFWELDIRDYNPNRKRRSAPAQLFDNRIHETQS